MMNKCIYLSYIFCKSWYEPNGFHAEIPYSGIFVLVWTGLNAILKISHDHAFIIFCGQGAPASTGLIRRNLQGSPLKSRITAYISLVQSQLDYCSNIWDPHLKQDTGDSQKVQCKAACWAQGECENWQCDWAPMWQMLNCWWTVVVNLSSSVAPSTSFTGISAVLLPFAK